MIRVNPYLTTVVQFSSMLDKLGVTGSSPAAPTSSDPAPARFLLGGVGDRQVEYCSSRFSLSRLGRCTG